MKYLEKRITSNKNILKNIIDVDADIVQMRDVRPLLQRHEN